MDEQKLNPIEEVKSPNNIWITVIAIIITAVLVGGGVYAWQKTSQQSTKESFNKQIAYLQSQITDLQQTPTPVITENKIIPETSTLTEKLESTDSTDQPINKTTIWKTYENQEIGFSFQYPENYGDFEIEVNEGETGKKFTGSFQNNKHFSLGAITEDYSAGRSGYFLDFVEYLYEDNNYYHLMALNKKWLVEPIKTMTVNNQQVLIVNGHSYVEERNAQGPTINPGPNGGALINLPGTSEFKGIAIINHDITNLVQSDFEEIIKTFNFTK